MWNIPLKPLRVSSKKKVRGIFSSISMLVFQPTKVVIHREVSKLISVESCKWLRALSDAYDPNHLPPEI